MPHPLHLPVSDVWPGEYFFLPSVKPPREEFRPSSISRPPKGQRTVAVRMSNDYVGLKFEETAAALGIAVPTAKQWWAYARAWVTVEMPKTADG